MVEVKLCAIGDLNGDGSLDAAAAALFTPNEATGRFWSVAVWRNSSGQPVFTAMTDFDDRSRWRAWQSAANGPPSSGSPVGRPTRRWP